MGLHEWKSIPRGYFACKQVMFCDLRLRGLASYLFNSTVGCEARVAEVPHKHFRSSQQQFETTISVYVEVVTVSPPGPFRPLGVELTGHLFTFSSRF